NGGSGSMRGEHMSYAQMLLSTIDRGALRALLWAIRKCGLGPSSSRQQFRYRWVRSFDGSFDHWFDVEGQATAVLTLRRDLGFWRFTVVVLSQCRLLTGKNRRDYYE